MKQQEGGDLLSAEEQPEQPEYFLLLRKLRMYAGNGTTPFLEPGGYMDQPWLASLALEACMSGEKKFQLQVQLAQQRLQRQQGEMDKQGSI